MATIEVCDRCEQKKTRDTKQSWEIKFRRENVEDAKGPIFAILCPACAEAVWTKVLAACSPPAKRKGT